MRASFQRFFAFNAMLCACACGSSAPAPNPADGGAGGAELGGSAPVAGSPAAGVSGLSTGGSGGGAGPAGGSGSAGANSAGAGAGGAGLPANFACTEYLGLLTTNEWYSQGFEAGGVDGTKWELKYHHYGYVRTWADPQSPFWADTGDSFDLQKGSPLQSPCSANPTSPDRLVFAALDWEMLNEADWAAALESALVTFKQKYPSLRWLDVMTMIRCPGNQKCNPNAKYGPGANAVAGRQDCFVPPYEDSAIEKFAAAHADFVGVGPRVEAPACRMPVDGAHLSADSNKAAALAISKYYAAHP